MNEILYMLGFLFPFLVIIFLLDVGPKLLDFGPKVCYFDPKVCYCFQYMCTSAVLLTRLVKYQFFYNV
jgi:hypothetical protein